MDTLVDNIPLRHAIGSFAEKPEQSTYLEVVRNLLQGDVLFDATGSDVEMSEDGSTPSPGSTLVFQGGEGPDGGKALLAFTRQQEVIRMHEDAPDEVLTLVQPAAAAFQFAADHDYAWLYLDPAGPSCVINLEEVAFALRSPRNDVVKAALNVEDEDARRAAVLESLAVGGQLLYGLDESGEGVRIRTSVDADGQSVWLAFTSAAEVVVRNVGDAWSAIDLTRIVSDALDDTFAALVINPAGPSVELRRDDLLHLQARLTT